MKKLELTKRQEEQLIKMLEYCNGKCHAYGNINIDNYNPDVTDNILKKLEKKMKKLIVFILAMFLITSCSNEPIMYSSNYQVVDTIGYNTNILRDLRSYDVIIKIDTSYFYGKLEEGHNYPYLIEMEGKINKEKLK